jgi:arginase
MKSPGNQGERPYLSGLSFFLKVVVVNSKLGIIGVPLDLGGNHRGVDMGPYAVRHAGLMERLRKAGFEVRDFGNIDVPVRGELERGDRSARYLKEITRVSTVLCERVKTMLEDGYTPITVGGDHSVALGSVAGVTAYRKEHSLGPIGLMWVDAHGDLNTPESSPTGNIHGMPAAVALGKGPEELVNLGFDGPKVEMEKLVQIGLRDLDPFETSLLSKGIINFYAMSEIDAYGIHDVTMAALEKATGNFVHPIHLSFDLDALDPKEAPGVGTPVEGGLTYREAHLLTELLASARLQDGSPVVASLDLVEVNPILDHRNRTADMAVSIAISVLRERPLRLRPLH